MTFKGQGNANPRPRGLIVIRIETLDGMVFYQAQNVFPETAAQERADELVNATVALEWVRSATAWWCVPEKPLAFAEDIDALENAMQDGAPEVPSSC